MLCRKIKQSYKQSNSRSSLLSGSLTSPSKWFQVSWGSWLSSMQLMHNTLPTYGRIFSDRTKGDFDVIILLFLRILFAYLKVS